MRAIRPIPGIELPKRLVEAEGGGGGAVLVEDAEVEGTGTTLAGGTELFEEPKTGMKVFGAARGVDVGSDTDFEGGLGKIEECEEEGVEGDSRVLKLTRFA